jgi:hypothetical protein
MYCASQNIVDCVKVPIPQQQKEHSTVFTPPSQSTTTQSSPTISDLTKVNDSTLTPQQVVQHIVSPFSVLHQQQSQVKGQYKAKSHYTNTYINQFYPSCFYNSDILVPTERQTTAPGADYSVWNVVVERNKLTPSYRKLIIQCFYDSVDDDCRYCLKLGKLCGKKLSKNEYLNKDDRVHSEMLGIQASTFIEFWIKIMKLQYPAANEDEILGVFKKSIEQREEKKRARSTVDDEDDDSTTDENMKDEDIGTNLEEIDTIQPTESFKLKGVSSIDLEKLPSLDLEAGHSLDYEEDHSLDRGMEEDEDDWWIKSYMRP